MTGMKKGGIILTGIGAYLILSKAINMVGRSVKNVSEAIKWKAYYKSNNCDAVPPGYTVRKANENDNLAMPKKDNASSKTLGAAVGHVVEDAIDSLFGKVKCEKDPVEGQTEASTDDIQEETEEDEEDEPSDSSINTGVWQMTFTAKPKDNSENKTESTVSNDTSEQMSFEGVFDAKPFIFGTVAEETSPEAEGDDVS